MYYPCSENKGADQLRSYCEADLRLCFRLCRLLVFPCGGSNLLILIVLAAGIEMHPGPRFQCRLCEIRLLNGQIVQKRFHVLCINLGKKELQKLESGSEC